MHFRHRQTDTDILAQVQDVYITSRAKNHRKVWHIHQFISLNIGGGLDLNYPL